MEDQGVDLRDFYAAHALQGLLACTDSNASFEQTVEYAWKYADAMLAAR